LIVSLIFEPRAATAQAAVEARGRWTWVAFRPALAVTYSRLSGVHVTGQEFKCVRRSVGLKICFFIEQNGNKWTADLLYLIQK
jgi:hypothetical protein